MLKSALIFCLLLSNFVTKSSARVPEKVHYVNNGPNVFDWNLVQATLSRAEESNVLISPLMVKQLLASLLDGAPENSKTYKEIARYMPQYGKGSVPDNYWEEVLKSLQEKSEDYDIAFATKNFVDNNVTLTEEFKSLSKQKYGTPLENIDFKNKENAEKLINKWVSTSTKGHIEELVSADELQDTIMTLLNAIYFQGTWENKFDRKGSFEGTFKGTKNSIKVTYMKQYANLELSELPTFKVLCMPYVGDKFSMYVVLPNKGQSLNTVIRHLTPQIVEEFQSKMEISRKVYVQLPKFKFNYSFKNLKENLEKLGIRSIFSSAADLSKMSETSDLQVSTILQKTGIIVDEDGTTAYGATGALIANRIGAGRKYFVVDRPFFFFIKDETTKAILFAGKVENPKF